MQRPELLAPAGSGPAMVAAVQCGADAIYLGAGDFNARKNADNFGGELEGAVGYCHARGVKAYVTLNTMVRQDELKRLENTIGEICRAGADGVIVQDFGTARAVKQMAPTLPLHASTQMAVHNAAGVEFLVKQGFDRVVLAREMNLKEIARCANLGAELEVFVHGALCVSCSGQCLMSSLIGGRSGNRGLCAQPCRMKYRLDDREGYLLSTSDLCGLQDLQALWDAGVNSLKVEGRLKRPEYVAQTISAYRSALNSLEKNQTFDLKQAEQDLRQMFNRGGFTRGYFHGPRERDLMYHDRPNHLGVAIGSCRRNGEIELETAIDGRDALALRRSGSEDIPVHPGSQGAGRLMLSEARKGDSLIRLVSQAQMKACQDAFAGEKKKFPIEMQLQLHVGSPAQLEIKDENHCILCSGEEVQAAQSRPADPDRIRAQMEKLGDTPFTIGAYHAEIDENAYVPVSALNALRRSAVEQLIEKRMGTAHACGRMTLPELPRSRKTVPELTAQSGSPEVLARALESGADFAVYAPQDLRTEALTRDLESLPERFDLALPPVMTDQTMNLLNAWALANAHRIRRTLISNIGQMNLAWPGALSGDLQLNIANELSIAQLGDWGLDSYTPSVELNRSQIDALGGRKQLVVYGALTLMHLRHCPLRAVRNAPGDHDSCRACDLCDAEKHISSKTLIDRTGVAFPLRRIAADSGCVVQLLNSAKLMLLRKHASLPACEGWRMLLDESDPIEAVVRLHRAALSGEDVRSHDDWAKIEAMNTTTGHYFRGAE